MKFPISPFAVVGFARSILARIKAQQQPAASARPTEKSNVSYASDGRSGRVIYKSAEASFSLYYEFGGGDCVACIDIPGPKDWEKTTGLPVERREEILNYIGQCVVNDQTTGGRGYFKIEGNWLNIYV